MASGQRFKENIEFNGLQRALRLDFFAGRCQDVRELFAFESQILCHLIHFILRVDCHVSS